MPSFAAAFFPMSDCVQNQSTSATATTAARMPTEGQEIAAMMGVM